jgi:hypothetical protein
LTRINEHERNCAQFPAGPASNISETNVMSEDFAIAVERARARIGERMWEALSLNLQSKALYEELRALDAERSGVALTFAAPEMAGSH